jgi:Glycosyl hydrolase family 26
MSSDQRRLRRIGRAITVTAACLVVFVAVVIAVRPSLLTVVKDAVVGDSTTAAAPAAPPAVEETPAPAAPVEVALPVVNGLPTNGAQYFGTSVKAGPTSSAAIDSFTAAVGEAPTVQLLFQAFGDGFDSSAIRQIVAEGRIPMLTWEPYDHRTPHEEIYPLTAMAAGEYDEYLRAEAAKFARLGSPLVLRFAHEMNGSWYPWGVAAGTNTAADYVAAWRHVHDVVTAAGATNVVWMWSPNLTDAEPDITLASVYPGDDYVDWVGLSGYYRQDADTFASRYTDTLTELDAVAPTKPIFVAETGVGDTANRAAQITDLVNGIIAAPRMIGFVWFNIDATGAWSVDDDPADAAVLGAALRAGDFGAVAEPVAAN